uniref:Uncharacterized protein n=1 Tax=Mantoniella antarctica TaxID=81844 RepID=A0A7S0S8X9_9CHLO|mmetsp:Transcript_11245/g.27413  ORF Transcript_11245/g.27413 Transcript_11245/m.27413 type:complete len:197 (+) Transcript_11245:43-633(+)
MASKGGGSRATGTDGSDHGFRQRVDTKYQKAAAARKSLKKTLLGLVAYYPLMLAFSLVPSFAKGGGVTMHNGPVAAGALGGLVLAAAAYVHVSRPGLNGAWLRAVTKVCAVLGIINLAAGISMRIFVYEDKRMAWAAAELAASLAPVGTLPGRVYPIMVSLELLLECVGVILPGGAVALAHALAMYSAPAAAAKSQ